MHRVQRVTLALVSILALLFSLAVSPGQALAAAPPAKYTILVYMNGSDLETNGGHATRDLAEMVQVGSSDRVNVLVETLGTARWTPPFIAGDRNQRWRVAPGNLDLVDDTVGRRDVADPHTLRDFIVWGMKAYPAEKYALIFWNHGGGAVGGYGHDETNPQSPSLGLEGIRQGIHDALQGTGQQFELIGFDTCLLATTELAAALSPYGRYMVASEELEPGHGWSYTPVLQAVQADPDITGDRLGRVIADSYRQQAAEHETDKMITLSVVDLARVQAVVDALQQFLSAAAPALEQADGLRTLQGARSKAESYGSTYDMVDLADLAAKASALAPQQAEQLAASIKAAVVYNVNSEGTPRASGLSVYFPHKGKHNIEARLNRYERTGFAAPYREFIAGYAAATFADKEPVQLVEQKPAADPAENRSTRFSVQVRADQADQVAAVYSILGQRHPERPDDLILLSFDNAVEFAPQTGKIDDTFTDSVATLNGHFIAMYLEEEGEDYDRYAIPIKLNGQPVTLIALYDHKTDRDVVVGAWPGIDPASGMARKEIIRIKPGDKITPLFEFYNEKTDEEGHYEGDEFLVKGKLDIGYTEVPPGTYLYGFQVVDYAGNEAYSDFTEVEVTYADGHRPAGESWEADEQPPRETEGALDLTGGPAPGGAPNPEPAPADGIRVILGGRPLRFDVAPEIRNGRTLVPLRAIFETLGATVAWDGATQTVTAVRSDVTIRLQVGNPVASRNGVSVALDQPPVIVGGRTLVPLRFVSEALGAAVGWNGDTRTITITPAP